MKILRIIFRFSTFFDSKSSGSKILGGAVENEIMSNQKLVEELHKPTFRKFEKRKVYSSFQDSIWGADLVDIQLISKFNKRFWILLCILVFIANMRGLFPWKIKNDIVITNASQKMLDESYRKPNKIFADKGSEF